MGLAAAAGLGRLLGNMLHGIDPHDPPTVAAVLAVLAAAALGAARLPARSAGRIDPAEVLRGD